MAFFMAQLKRLRGTLLLGSGLVLFTLGLALLLSPQTLVQAQCGASASSCKNCHEVNAKHPVNGSGEWHIKHAFGDFCSFCHGGDVQATDQDKAHVGMYYPLADIKTACQSCHPTDAQDRAKVYAVALGVDLNKPGAASTGPGNTGGSSGGAGTTPGTDTVAIPLKPIAAPGETAASGALIDYNRRYEIDVLHILDSGRAGNIVFAVAGVLLLVVGGALAWHYEHLGDLWRKARALPEWYRRADEYRVNGPVVNTPQVSAPVATTVPSAAVARPNAPVGSLPAALANLDDQTQSALRTLLADPQHGAAILRALSQLDASLIDSLQSLDRRDRALLIALVEKLGETKS